MLRAWGAVLLMSIKQAFWTILWFDIFLIGNVGGIGNKSFFLGNKDRPQQGNSLTLFMETCQKELLKLILQSLGSKVNQSECVTTLHLKNTVLRPVVILTSALNFWVIASKMFVCLELLF